MAITPTLFKVRFPEFNSQSDVSVQMWIDDAVEDLNETFWGDKYNRGLYYLSAHYLKKSLQSAGARLTAPANSGGINSRGVDGASVGYESSNSKTVLDSEYNSTIYGQRYLSLSKTLPRVAFTV